MNKFKKCNFYIFSIVFALCLSCSAAFAKVLDIVMCADNNYVYPTLVSMTSIMENKKSDTQPKFHLMLSGSVSEENKQKFKKFAEIYEKNDCSIDLIDMGDRFKNAKTTKNFTTPTYYRLIISSSLPDCEKALYIDGDTVVTKDLQELYDTDISNYYIAGCTHNYSSEDQKVTLEGNKYVNAGVLLFNLKNMRKDNIEKQMVDLIPQVKKRKFRWLDQSIINYVCNGKIKIIDTKYNAMTFRWPRRSKLKSLNKKTRNEIMNAYNNAVIIHYAAPRKPWKTKNVRKYDVWNKYRTIMEKKFEEKDKSLANKSSKK